MKGVRFIKDLGTIFPKHQRHGLYECPLCGNQFIAITYSVKKGNRKSCGCRANSYKHGETANFKYSRIYRTWAGMKSRIKNPNTTRYENYGGRGLTMYDKWEDFIPFLEWAKKSGYNDNLQIDRIDNNQGYYPENCRWVTAAQNSMNKRRKANYGIYKSRNGNLNVKIRRYGSIHYAGTVTTLKEAIKLRDDLDKKIELVQLVKSKPKIQ